MDDEMDALTFYWLKHYVVDGHCGLCGNSGMIDASRVCTPTGRDLGRQHFCLCPNGQQLRARHEQLTGAGPVIALA